MTEVLKQRRSSDISVENVDGGQVLITASVPWAEVVGDLNDIVKNLSSGYASFNYADTGFQAADLVKVEIAINGEACDPLSFITHSSKATSQGRAIASVRFVELTLQPNQYLQLLQKLKEVVERQQFEVIIQAKVGTKVLAKERIAPYRKDVLTKSGKVVEWF